MVRNESSKFRHKLTRELGDRAIGQMRFRLLALIVLAQLATVIITWPLWQVRDFPPAMPMFEVPQVPFGFFVVCSLLIIPIAPRPGIGVHALILILSAVFDQFRLQPQFYAHVALMIGLSSDVGSRLGRWICATLWFWAGLHKALSLEWWEVISPNLMQRMPVDLSDFHLIFGISVVIGEMSAGLLAIFRPKWALLAIAPMHVGIALFLVAINWNFSVIPWNLAMAVGGTWLLWEAWKRDSVKRWEWGVLAAGLILPLGFYVAKLDHGFSHVLYSGTLPQGQISKPQETVYVTAWGKLAIPFPKERRLHRNYFEHFAEPGDKLHIADQRWLLDDLYFQLSDERIAVEITPREFYDSSDGVQGVGVELKRDMLALLKANTTLMRRQEDGPVYAVQFDPNSYHSDLLWHLKGIPNVEQIQLSDTQVKDEDLRHLKSLYRLQAIGLSRTRITDRGLEYLRKLPEMERVDRQGTGISIERLEELGWYSND